MSTTRGSTPRDCVSMRSSNTGYLVPPFRCFGSTCGVVTLWIEGGIEIDQSVVYQRSGRVNTVTGKCFGSFQWQRCTMQLPIHMLLVIDGLSVRDAVKRALDQRSFLMRSTSNLAEAVILLQEWQPHIVVVDMCFAEGKVLVRLGYSSMGVNVPPAIAIAPRDDPALKVAALEDGADDVVVFPFHPEEFLARVMVIVRRTYREAAVLTPILRVGDIEIDTFRRQVCVNGAKLRLTALEQRLLYLLASHAGQILTRDEILDSIWGADYIAESNVVDRHIHNLRVKLKIGGCRSHAIVTVHGRGYRLAAAGVTDMHSSSRTQARIRRDQGFIGEPGFAVQESG